MVFLPATEKIKFTLPCQVLFPFLLYWQERYQEGPLKITVEGMTLQASYSGPGLQAQWGTMKENYLTHKCVKVKGRRPPPHMRASLYQL